MGGYIMQLQNFSVNDGDGIRTTIFMAGCPLRCAWCANPEGQTCRNAMTHWAETSEVLQKMDLIFMDLKHPDSEAHRRFTGVGNETILQNLQKTAALDIPLVVRIPMIAGVNTDASTLHKAFAFISTSCPGAQLELLPYHRYGETKYDALGLPRPSAAFAAPTKAQLSGWEQLAAQEYGIKVTSYK